MTGHDPSGRSIVVSDDVVLGHRAGDLGSGAVPMWGRDDVPVLPDGGSEPARAGRFPPPGGSRLAILQIAPGDGTDLDRHVDETMSEWRSGDRAGMHRTPSVDYVVVIDGRVGLELDRGDPVVLGPGDVVVQNGTNHRWRNLGQEVARLGVTVIGAHIQDDI